jgi:hypothetical protein
MRNAGCEEPVVGGWSQGNVSRERDRGCQVVGEEEKRKGERLRKREGEREKGKKGGRARERERERSKLKERRKEECEKMKGEERK